MKYIRLGDVITTLYKYFPLSFERQEAEDDLKSIPAEDVEKVRHSKWECIDECNNWWMCTGKDGCGGTLILEEGTPKDNNYKRCPNCGAKMDEKEKRE